MVRNRPYELIKLGVLGLKFNCTVFYINIFRVQKAPILLNTVPYMYLPCMPSAIGLGTKLFLPVLITINKYYDVYRSKKILFLC